MTILCISILPCNISFFNFRWFKRPLTILSCVHITTKIGHSIVKSTLYFETSDATFLNRLRRLLFGSTATATYVLLTESPVNALCMLYSSRAGELIGEYRNLRSSCNFPAEKIIFDRFSYWVLLSYLAIFPFSSFVGSNDC